MADSIEFQRELLKLVQTRTADPSLAGAPSLLTAVGPVEQAQGAGTVASATDGVSELADELESLRRQLGATEETARRQADILEQNTRAVLESGSGSGTSAADLARSAASTVQSSGALAAFSSPLAGLVSLLFRRGGDSSATSELTPARLPTAIDQSLGISSLSGPAPVTYLADGTPRQITQASPSGASNITVHVQAMDSRSFLDNSDQIASAVREAMLNSHAINDVIGEM